MKIKRNLIKSWTYIFTSERTYNLLVENALLEVMELCSLYFWKDDIDS